MAKKNTVNLDDWYTNEQAVDRLSANSGRAIDKNYPRTLARYGKVRSLEIGARGKLYFKADIDGYVVSEKRGKKPALKKEESAA